MQQCDAYWRMPQPQTWVMGTGLVEKTWTLDEAGRFTLRSHRNLATGYEWAQGGDLSGDEFGLTFNGAFLTGSTGGWAAVDAGSQTGPQGELTAHITLRGHGLAVTRHYVAYPGTGVIQEWTAYVNETGVDAKVDDPMIFRQKLAQRDTADGDFYYMTGGGNFAGSTMLKKLPMAEGLTRRFDSYTDMETCEVDGHIGYHETLDREQGTGIWYELYALRNRAREEGVVLTFDYNGYWQAQYACLEGGNTLYGWCHLTGYDFPAGETLTLPPAMTCVFTGDEDDMGNTLTAYEYRYKWDYTREAYFNKSSMAIWKESPLTEDVFQMVDNARYIGMERIWVDDFWFDAKGLWNGTFGDDWTALADYIRKNGMLFRLWMPPWHADRLSGLQVSHPEWLVGWSGWWYNWTIDLGQEEAYQWVLDMLTRKQQEFGDYDLRVDGSSSRFRNAGSFVDAGGDYNVTFKQSENWYRLCREFKERNPKAGLDGCSSGGCAMTIESIRYADQQQITDGWCFHMGGYWTTLFLPIDKHQGFPMAGSSLARGRYTPAQRNLFVAPTTFAMRTVRSEEEWADRECVRKDMELFRWLRDVGGVYGKGVKVYRPRVEVGDPTFVLQRMSEDNRRGLLLFSNDSHNPMTGHPVRVFPKGLLPEEDYTLECLEGGMQTATRKGADWMAEGVALSRLNPGEYVLLNLTDRPGSGADTQPPTAPGWAKQAPGQALGHAGVEIAWGAGSDETFLSHYEIWDDAQLVTRVSTGTYCFLPDADPATAYRVRSVDGDGNVSNFTRTE